RFGAPPSGPPPPPGVVRADGGRVPGAVVDPARPGPHHRGRGGPDTPSAGARPDGPRVHAAVAFPAARRRRDLTAAGAGGLDVPRLKLPPQPRGAVHPGAELMVGTTVIFSTPGRQAADGPPHHCERCDRALAP